MWEKLDEFQRGVKQDDKRKWDVFQACEIMGVNPEWFVDERSIEMIERYLFFRQDPSRAFPGPFEEQPAIWIQNKVVLDAIIGPIGVF